MLRSILITNILAQNFSILYVDATFFSNRFFYALSRLIQVKENE